MVLLLCISGGIFLGIFVLLLAPAQAVPAQAGPAVPAGGAGARSLSWLLRARLLTAFLPCPLQRRKRERRWAGTLAAEGRTPGSPRSRMEPLAHRSTPRPHGQARRDPPVPRPQWELQQVTRTPPREASLCHPTLAPPPVPPTPRGKPWGSQPQVPAPGHLGTGGRRRPVPLLPPRQRADSLGGPSGGVPRLRMTPSSRGTLGKVPGGPRCPPRHHPRKERNRRGSCGSPRPRPRGQGGLSPRRR